MPSNTISDPSTPTRKPSRVNPPALQFQPPHISKAAATRISSRCLWTLCLALLLADHLPRAFAQELFTESSDPATSEVDRIYLRGLQFLARNQGREGSWNDQPYGREPAVVGLAMMCILARGDDPNTGPFADTLRRGYDYILGQIDTESGYIGRTMYNHGFSTLALAEAYGVLNHPRLGFALEKAVKLIVNAQAQNPLGAWRYTTTSKDADTTVSGAQMVALFAARNAGLAVPEDAIQKGLKFFQQSQNADGGFSYTPGSSSNAPRTAIGALVMALAKQKETAGFRRAMAYLQKAPADTMYQQYYLYYAAQAFFHASPELWAGWNRSNIRSLATTQLPDGGWEGPFGATFATSASLLSLALNYRYLPIYER